ncbi:nitrile hydratase subunit beta [Mycolicibacterium novocastrense]|uniref:nitrile hydratase n=1 Tax=Mycolicibacterium novocastrense TaxID=59813 RepID=A0AAW5SQN2_MYCNV|nr:nitrile hydratase subunit beta [Mycolicibacterium novocastrense]MCV7025357.1 nitrile hydratase subunit beta [Mycolicibacterium novocastrense]GAT08986.1 nitrile hydratase [Mycolicibacterium novocastrense]
MPEEYVNHADIGGRLRHGPIEVGSGREMWRAAWEPRVFALQLSMGAAGVWNLDMTRAARETLPDYAQRSYYEVWFAALVNQLRERDLISPDELASGRSMNAPPALPRILRAGDVRTVQARGAPTERFATSGPRFAVGQRVRTTAAAAPHHTRLPGYARGKSGVIEQVHGVHVFADTNASGQGEQPRWLYGVVFCGTELWPDAEPTLTVSIDAWEPYLEAG